MIDTLPKRIGDFIEHCVKDNCGATGYGFATVEPWQGYCPACLSHTEGFWIK